MDTLLIAAGCGFPIILLIGLIVMTNVPKARKFILPIVLVIVVATIGTAVYLNSATSGVQLIDSVWFASFSTGPGGFGLPTLSNDGRYLIASNGNLVYIYDLERDLEGDRFKTPLDALPGSSAFFTPSHDLLLVFQPGMRVYSLEGTDLPTHPATGAIRFVGRSNVQPWADAVPYAWRAASDAQAIYDVGVQALPEQSAGMCNYRGGVQVERFTIDYQATIIHRAEGTVVAERRFDSEQACAQRVEGAPSRFVAAVPGPQPFVQWLASTLVDPDLAQPVDGPTFMFTGLPDFHENETHVRFRNIRVSNTESTIVDLNALQVVDDPENVSDDWIELQTELPITSADGSITIEVLATPIDRWDLGVIKNGETYPLGQNDDDTRWMYNDSNRHLLRASFVPGQLSVWVYDLDALN